MKWFILLLLAFALVGCRPDNATALRAISDNGFEDINLEDHNLFGWGCPEDMGMNEVLFAVIFGAPV